VRAPRVAVVLGSTVLVVVGLALTIFGPEPGGAEDSTRPVAGGWFRLQPPGSWKRLPSDSACAAKVHQSSWEPRPVNDDPNHHVPDQQAVHKAFAERPRAGQGTYDKRWDSWLLPRVTGNHTGTTDENIQWAACKWGLPDDLLRSIAYAESTWYQAETRRNGRCVEQHGCGDVVPEATASTKVFCRQVVAAAGTDYQRWYGAGRCPRTFSIVGVMSWQDPKWGPMPDNQNGTFPFNHRSTAFALDYVGAFLRGCDEGWIKWLDDAGGDYRPGDIWGCVGTWYAGAWKTTDALVYAGRVRAAEQARPWLRPGFSEG